MSSNPVLIRPEFESVASALEEHLKSAENVTRLNAELNRELIRREVYFGDNLLPSFPMPDLLPLVQEQQTAHKVEAMVSLLERVGHQILADTSLRRELGFGKIHDELLDIDPGYERLIIISRLDMSCVGSCNVFEVNTDSPAMMTFTDQLEDILLSTSIGQVLNMRRERYRMTRVMLDGLLAAYREWGGTRDDPTIAIVDWPGEMTASELRHTAMAFTEMGCPAVVAGPADLSIVDGKAHAHGRRVDIIQRRVLFPDFIRRESELKVFSDISRRGLACVANPLRSIVVGNKAVLALLSENSDRIELTDADRELIADIIPETIRLTSSNVDRFSAEKDQWVIKSSMGSGGKAVSLGVSADSGSWQQLLDCGIQSPTIAQRKQPIPIVAVPIVVDDKVEMRKLYANWNPWVFGGNYAGASTRVSTEKIVSITAGGGLLPAFGI